MRSFHVACLGDVGRPAGKTWYCSECKNDAHSCFICKEVGQDYTEVTKCSVELCGKYYHEKCLRSLPDEGYCSVSIKKSSGPRPRSITQTEGADPGKDGDGSTSTGGTSSSNGSDSGGGGVEIDILSFKCPYHSCWTCSEWHDAQGAAYRKKVKGGGFKVTELYVRGSLFLVY